MRNLIFSSNLAFTVLFISAGNLFANNVGAPTQNFSPSADGKQYITVQSAKSLKQKQFNLGLFVDYATNTLPYFSEDSAAFQSRNETNDAQVHLDVHGAIGITDQFSLGLNLPYVVKQWVKRSDDHGQYRDSGILEGRLSAKYKFYDVDGLRFAQITSLKSNQITELPYQGAQTEKPSFVFEFAAEKDLAAETSIALNLGYLWRLKNEPIPGAEPLAPLGSEWIGSVAFMHHLAETKWNVISEIFGSLPASDAPKIPGRSESAWEAIVGLRYDFDRKFSSHAGSGTELVNGRSTPDWRFYAGLNYTNEAPEETAEVPPHVESSAEQPSEVFVIEDIKFDFNSAKIRDQASREKLDRFIKHVQSTSGELRRIEIVGHADAIGSHRYNDRLSRTRAGTIKKYLSSQGLSQDKLTPIGKGKREPLVSNNSDDGRAKNRRVEFRIFRS